MVQLCIGLMMVLQLGQTLQTTMPADHLLLPADQEHLAEHY